MIDANDDLNQGNIVIYQTDNGNTKIDVRFVDESVWLTQQQMAELFQSSRTNIVEHIKNIYDEGELDEKIYNNTEKPSQDALFLDNGT